jgi:hypothetical protein
MPWPRRQKITELELKHQFDTLQLQLVRLREQLTNKERYAAKLELLLRERLTRIDELKRHNRPPPRTEPAHDRRENSGAEPSLKRRASVTLLTPSASFRRRR